MRDASVEAEQELSQFDIETYMRMDGIYATQPIGKRRKKINLS